MLVRQPKINFKMTVRADCAVSACSSLPLPIKSLAHWLSVGGSLPLDRHPHSLLPPTYPFFSSIQFMHLDMSDSLWPHGLQHTRLLCLSPTPRVYSNSYPLSFIQNWWCHPAISSSVSRFSSCFQSFPASGSLLVSQFFTSGGQSIGVSA